MLSGVPQGTVLAANLFLILINSMKTSLNFCQSYTYADDTKLLKKKEIASDAENFGADLNAVCLFVCFKREPFAVQNIPT